MFLIGHAAIGAAIVGLAGIHNPAAAFAVGWASHYLGDLVPHGDEAVGEWAEGPEGVGRLSAIVFADIGILAAILSVIIMSSGFSWILIAAVAGSLLPDFLWGFEKLFGGKMLGAHAAFHLRNHNYFRIRIPFIIGLFGQLILTYWLWHRIIVSA